MKFKTSILQMGNNTGIEVPTEVVEGLGGGKKPAVKVMGGKFLILLSAERRAAMPSRWNWRSTRSRGRSLFPMT